MLGVGHYEVLLTDRGGSRPIGALGGVAQLRWTRTRDDISEAVVQLRGAPAWSNVVRQARTIRHEMVVLRDGQRVWEGPVTRIQTEGNFTEIAARDVLWFASRTAVNVHAQYAYTANQDTIITVAERLLGMAYNKQSDWANVWKYRKKIASAKDGRFFGEWTGYAETVYDILERMSSDWDLDYAAVGRRIYWNDVHTKFAYTRPMTDDDFLGPISITEYGNDFETKQYITGAKHVWERKAAQNVLDYYGPIELVRAGDDEAAEPPLLPPLPHFDRPTLDYTHPPIRLRVPDNSQINPRSPIDIKQLVPGVWIPIETTRFNESYTSWTKLNTLNVTWSPPGGEKCEIVLGPAPGSSNAPL